ncbi:MAG: HAD family hydrolase [Oscillospiraceae bacterium]|nr:HAD family hydrolase [Oscillospiraceae bacterium]
MKLRAPIKGIFFDAGWTLFYQTCEYWWFPKECIDPHLFNGIPDDKRDAVLQKALKYLDDNHLILTEEEEIEQFKTVYSMISSDLPELALTKQKIDTMVHEQVSGTYFCFYDDTLPTLKTLRGKYKLGVISDFWPSLKRILKNGGADSYFSAMTISSYLGTFKSSPDRRMYLHALEQMKLPPEQTIFIDDGVENLEGAEKCGIQPVLITAKPYPESSDKYPSIKKLWELLELLP